MQLLVAEFNDRRTEINNRTTIQHVIISLNITAAGAIFGLAVARDEPLYTVTLLLAPVCSALAMLWANHADTIARIGAFIRFRIRPIVAGENDLIWRWELDHDVFGAAPNTKFVRFELPVFWVFIGPPVTGLGFSLQPLLLDGTVVQRIVYVAASLLTLSASILLTRAMRGANFSEKLELDPDAIAQGVVKAEGLGGAGS